MAKAVHRGPSRLGLVIKAALVRHYGSLKAAAITLGDYDLSQLGRDLESGKFKLERIDEHADDDAKASIAAALYEAFGASTDPKAAVLRELRAARQRIDDAMEALERIC